MIAAGTRVKVAACFPESKAKILQLVVGDVGTVLSVIGGIALVSWDKGHRTTANVIDLEKD